MSHTQAPDESILSQHREAMERGAQCTSCPLYGCKQGPVMPRLQERSMMLVVSESPSLSDVESGKPLQGHSGEVLNESLAAGNVSRADCSVTYAVLCRPPGGHVLDYAMTLRKAARKTAKAHAAANEGMSGGKGKASGQKASVSLPQDCCAPRLAMDFSQVDTRVILTLGSESLKAAARTLKLPFGATKSPPGSIRVASLRKQLGAPVLAPTGQTLIATLHPAFVMGGMATFQHVMRQDIERAASLAQRGGRIHWHEPEAILKPSADTAVNVMEAMRQSGALITVDIETDGIDTMRCHVRCVGLGAILDGREVVAVIPLRHMSGLPWWSPAQEARVTNALTRLLEEAPLAGHNLSFDTAVLLNNVLMKNRNKCWMDTLIASKNTFRSELPHDLGFVSSRYFEAPHWKDDADAKSVSGVDDYWLHVYNFRDILNTMRLVPRLLERIDEDGTLNSFRTDTRLGPIVRDMGDLGLTLNEERRLTHFKTLDLVADKRGKEVCRVVGDSSFNPNATHQVSKFLYITKGLSPPFTTDGIEWSEVNDDSELPIDTSDPDTIIEHASTDEAALLKLLDLGVDTETAAFIEALLAYRGLRKCCSTFLGYKWRDQDDGRGRILVDTFREKGFIREESWGPGLENLSVLHPSWRPVGTACVTHDTWVLTANGPRRIGDLQGFPEAAGVRPAKGLKLNDGERNQRVSHLVNSGDCTAVTIRTRLGLKLTGTPHHRVIRGEFHKGKTTTSGARHGRGQRDIVQVEPRTSWCRLDELRRGDYVRLAVGQNAWSEKVPDLKIRPFERKQTSFKKKVRIPTKVSLELAEFIGMYTADGSLHDGNGSFSIRISNRKPEVMSRARELMSLLFDKDRVSQDEITTIVTSIALKTWAEDVGLKKTIYKKGIPEWLLSSPKEYVAAYIRGCSLDSFIYLKGETTPVWRYTGTYRLAEEMQMLLLNFGIVASLRDVREPLHGNTVMCFVYGFEEVKAVCALTKQKVPQPTREPTKFRRNYCVRDNGIWVRVNSVTRENTKMPMRDVTVPSTSRFWSNGFISHNTGRFTVKPNVQAWPERVVFDIEAYKSSDGKDGILNTRSIVVAPPGYVLVGADLAAVELRLYAMFSRDALLLDAIAKGKDPHALNYATMQSNRPADMARWYEKVMGSKPQVKKYLRNIAKRFCIAEGELVLVRRVGAVLEVPIEKVLRTDEVWDGVEWVTHDGVVDQGIKEVIFHDGLWATADHEVFLADGRTCTHGEAKHFALRLARGSESGRPVRLVDSGEGSADASGVATVRPGEVREVRTREGGDAGEPALRENESLSRMLLRARELASVALESFLAGEAAVRALVASGLERLRWARYRVPLRIGGSSSEVGTRKCLTEAGVDARSNQQQRSLRAWEHSFCFGTNESNEQTQHEVVRGLEIPPRILALRGSNSSSHALCRDDAKTDSQSCAADGATASRTVATNKRTARVYDLLNAGPRRRFTASGIIVSNCFLIIFGGESETLFKTMAADRNPDGTRSFPDLKFSDVQMWTANWHRLHPETKAWHDAILRAWQQHGFVASLIDGRRRFFLGGIQDRNAILNAPVQSSTAAIANRALIAISEACPHRGWAQMAGPMLQVHDFIGIQVPIERQKEAEDLLIREIPYEHNGMRFDVEQKSGPSWDKT